MYEKASVGHAGLHSDFGAKSRSFFSELSRGSCQGDAAVKVRVFFIAELVTVVSPTLREITCLHSQFSTLSFLVDPKDHFTMKTYILKLALVLPWSIPACSAFVLIQPRAMRHHTPSTTAVSYTNSNTDVLPFVLRPFDLNGDGKLDDKDIRIFQSNVVNALDLNGDGEINEKDAWRALQLVVISWALTVSPVAAKGGGGGGGGGGHGGGGHSYSSSYHSFSSSSGSSRQYHSSGGGHYYVPSSHSGSYIDYYPTTQVLEPYGRKWYGRNRKYNKPWNPAACYDLPGEGEIMNILLQEPEPLFHSSYYGPGVVQKVNEPTCMFDVNVGGSIQSFKTPRNWEVRGELMCSLFVTFHIVVVGHELWLAEKKLQDKLFDEELLFDEEFARQRGSKEFQLYPIPASGKYIGSTQESDGANQAIEVKLHFDEETRTITGSGYDSNDGNYSLDGEWVCDKVKWTEYYNGFTVKVRGELIKDGTKIDCRFVSTRGIRGTFNLCAKKFSD